VHLEMEVLLKVFYHIPLLLWKQLLSSLSFSAVRELITAHPDNLATVLKHTIYSELSTARNPNNMAMISVMFQSAPDSAATILAEIFQVYWHPFQEIVDDTMI
jgi:integrator complex subunit 1